MMRLSDTKACLIGQLCTSFFFTLLSSHPVCAVFLPPPLRPPPPSMSTNIKPPPCLQELSPSPQFIVNGATRLDVRQGKLSECMTRAFTTCSLFWLESQKKRLYPGQCQAKKPSSLWRKSEEAEPVRTALLPKWNANLRDDCYCVLETLCQNACDQLYMARVEDWQDVIIVSLTI